MSTHIATLETHAKCLIEHVKKSKSELILFKIKQGFKAPNIIFKECLIVLKKINDPHKDHLIEPLKKELRNMY